MPKPHEEGCEQSNFNDYALHQTEYRVDEERGAVEFYQRRLFYIEELIRKEERRIHDLEFSIKSCEQQLSALQKTYEQAIAEIQETVKSLKSEMDQLNPEKNDKTRIDKQESLLLSERNLETLKRNQLEDMSKVRQILDKAKLNLQHAKENSAKEGLVQDKIQIQGDLKIHAYLLKETEMKLREMNVKGGVFRENPYTILVKFRKINEKKAQVEEVNLNDSVSKINIKPN